MSFRIEFEWVDAGASRDVLARQTMADVRVSVDGVDVTANIDRALGAYRDRLTVPLYPLAEWVVANWWSLWFEPDLAGPGRPRDGFEARHSMAYAGRGFIFPRMSVTSLNGIVQLRASAWRPAHASIELLRDLTAHVQRGDVEAELSRVVDAVIQRLAEFRTPDDSLEQDWRAIKDVDAETRAFCEAAGALGLDPFDVDEPTADAIVAMAHGVPDALREDLFSSTDVAGGPQLVEWVRSRVARASQVVSSDAWGDLREQLGALSSALPWTQGYDLARKTRQLIGRRDARFEFAGDWSVGFEVDQAPSDRLEGVVSATAPSCLIGPRHPSGERFLIARAVGAYLVRRNGSAALLTTLATSSQAITRAFAAELLAPSGTIRARLQSAGPERFDADVIDRMATEFAVSPWVVKHQIENHKLGAPIEQ